MKQKLFFLPKIGLITLTAVMLFTLGAVVTSCKDDKDGPKPQPTIESISPTSALPGETVTIKGKDFSAETSKNIVKFGDVTATVTECTATEIKVTVPASLTNGSTVKVTVTTDGQISKEMAFTVDQPTPVITKVSPESALPGKEVTITGSNFSTTAESNTVKFGDKKATVNSSTATELKVTVPVELSEGAKVQLTVTANEKTSASVDFTVATDPVPKINSLSASELFIGEELTITGEKFSTTAAENKVTFGATTATIVGTPTATEIKVTVPNIKADKYALKVTTNSNESETKEFTVKAREMKISGFSTTTEYKKGETVKITGENFGTDNNDIEILINDKKQTIGTVKDSEITFALIAKTFSGKITVKKDDGINPQEKTSATEMQYVETYTLEAQDFYYSKDGKAKGIDIDKDGNVIVAINKGIVKLDSKGALVTTYCENFSFFGFYGLIVRNETNEIYAADHESGDILKFTGVNTYETIFKRNNTPVTYLSENDKGELIFSDMLANKVYKSTDWVNLSEDSISITYPRQHMAYGNGILVKKDSDTKIYNIDFSGNESEFADCNSVTTSIGGGMEKVNDKIYTLFTSKDKAGIIKEGETTCTILSELTGVDEMYDLVVNKEGDLLITYIDGVKKLKIE